MDRDKLLRRLMKTFLDELAEHIQTLDRDLLALERRPEASVRTEIIKNLFRTAHSLKGAARSVNVGVLEAAAHCLESIFAGVRDGAISLDPELFRLLFEAIDAIRDVDRRLHAKESIDDSPLAALLSRLRVICRSPSSAPQLRASPSMSADGEATPTSPSATKTPPDEAPALPTKDGSVRLSSAKLDQMLSLGGELLVARRRIEGRDADVDRLVEMAKRWDAEWRMAEGGVRNALRQNGNSPNTSRASARTVHSPTRLMERTRENLQWLTRQLDNLASGLAADRRVLEQVAAPLEAEVVRARMVPFAEACEGFPRAVRDLARNAGKEVNLIVEGGEIEIDRSIAEGIKDPLLHLIRNAVDHGIEIPAARVAAGKATQGRITIGAALRSGRIEIVVADDGSGFNADAVREQARKRNLPIPENDQEIARLVFAPGFSTSPIVTTISGRGVGLDVVKTAVESRRGSVNVASEPGSGTRFVLSMPLSLAILPALLVMAGGQTYAFDNAAVRSLMRVGTEELGTIEGRDVLTSDRGPVPVFSLTEILGQPTYETPRVGGKAPVVILGAGADLAAFAVDELLAEQEVVVKDLGPHLRRVCNVTGATVLPTGRIALILNATDLVRTALGHAPSQTLSAALAAQPTEAKKRLLVIDDSVTTRTLVKSILEAAGYEVLDAVDGMEAWQILQEKGADLVVSDVEMPRMDGFALTEAIRGSKRLQNLPVILVTAMETEQDRMRGLDAGANAYLLKSAFDQTNLIETINQIL